MSWFEKKRLEVDCEKIKKERRNRLAKYLISAKELPAFNSLCKKCGDTAESKHRAGYPRFEVVFDRITYSHILQKCPCGYYWETQTLDWKPDD